VRLDLGILQMHTEGRPDGQRPGGYDSMLEMYEAQLDQAEQEESDESDATSTPPESRGNAAEASSENIDGSSSDEDTKPADKFSLSPDQCQALRDEAVQYYHRYMALMILEDYEGVVRDTTRNIRVLDLCAKHAEAEQDREALEQYRPYITMVRARAVASQALKDNEPKAAIHAIDEGLEQLRKHFAEQGEADGFDQSTEVQMLRGMRESLVPKLPVSQKSELRNRLQRAVEQENYKLAAILRDELRLLDKEGA
jgi:UvrB/uvrC motif